MQNSLEDIFNLEDQSLFDEAYDAYNARYSQSPLDYEVWKHFYFFLWTAIEDAPSAFHERIGLRQKLQTMFDEGKTNFSHLPDFNFIAGYTVSIFPYEYGDYETLEEEGRQMLSNAAKLAPTNPIYKLAYLGSSERLGSRKYRKARIEAQNALSHMDERGMLNRYFKMVFKV